MIRPIQIHIPKTGGLSVRIYLRSVIGMKVSGKKFHPPVDNAKVAQWAAALARQGHQPYYFTFVREPIERLISSFAFMVDRLKERQRITGVRVFWDKKKVRSLIYMRSDQKGPPTADQFFQGLLDNWPALKGHLGMWRWMFAPQVRWTSSKKGSKVNLYDFADLKNEVSSLLSECGLEDPDLPFVTSHGSGKKPEVSPMIIDKLTMRYEQDFILYRTMLKEKQVRLSRKAAT